MFSINETGNGNSNIEMANSYMRTAKELESERMEIVKKNPEKFS
jgi:hypothetical protein